MSECQVSGLLDGCYGKFARYAWEILEKLIQGIARLKIVQQSLERHASSRQARRTLHNFRITRNSSVHRQVPYRKVEEGGKFQIAKALKARNSGVAVDMAQRLAPFWSQVAGRTEKPALFAATIIVAAKLKDATIAATLLQPFGLTALAGRAALRLTNLLNSYGIDWCRTLFQHWESQEENEPPKGRLAWMESTLAILCRALCETPPGRELAGWVLTKQWEFILERSRQISKYASAKDITREMVSLCTRRTGRPFTLVLEKTAILFERAAAERQSLREDLAWLEKTAAEF